MEYNTSRDIIMSSFQFSSIFLARLLNMKQIQFQAVWMNEFNDCIQRSTQKL